VRIGIIGAGVSGMTAAWLLQHDHQVTLLDGAPWLGGHVQTLPVVVGGDTVHAELGTRFFFDASYPHFVALLRLLAVPLRWTDTSFSFTDVARGRTVVLPPRSLRHLASLLRWPEMARHALSLRRLLAGQPAIAARRDFSVTLRRHLAEASYPPSFGPDFAYPFLAGCWGAPLDELPGFPVYSLLKVMGPGKRSGFYEIPGGMSRYVETLAGELTRVEVHLGTAVVRVDKELDFQVEDADGARRSFDRLIVATSARDAAGLLRGVPGAAALREAAAAFRHFETEIAVHGDRSFMPADQRDWSHSNVFVDGGAVWSSDWPGHARGAPVIRTWLPKGRPLPRPLYGRRSFHHLLMSPENGALQRRLAAHQGAAGVWLAGMYAVDVDNHESALVSALAPAAALAPGSPNLRRLLGAVAAGGAHRPWVPPRGES
jgi:predicted NAD/FAD-binding protein